MCGEYLDVWNGRYKKEDWQIKIYGIEIYEGYHNPIWDYVYDEVLMGNALENIERFSNIDLIIMADVIEHLEKNSGVKLVEKCLNFSKRF